MMKPRTKKDPLVERIAEHLGVKPAPGGWIVDDNGNRICKGWDAYATICRDRGWIVSRGNGYPDHVDWDRVGPPAWVIRDNRRREGMAAAIATN